jgi:glycosyltransferase involved in cell wall biosynthesis
VIPHFYRSREKNLQGLLEDLRQQSFKELEVIVVPGVSPQGKAINEGVRSAQGEILVIIDDDSRLGHPRVIENLVGVIRGDRSIGMAGASVVTAEKASGFQKMAARQFPRFGMPVVQEITESDLPGHPCAAFPKKVFIGVGMEREDILRGLDPDLRVRIRKAGYRIVLAPDTWIHHPLPENLFEFIRVFLRNGYGAAYLQRFYPEINYDTDEATDSKDFAPKHSFVYRVLRYPVRLALSLVGLQWIRLIGDAVYILGYLAGWFRFLFSPRKMPRAYPGHLE